MTTRITTENITDATIGTADLASSVPLNTQWQAVFVGDGSTGLTAVAGRGYFINTTSGTVTVTLPASPSAGDTIAIKDYAGTFNSNALTIARNGKNIQGVANDSLISTVRASVVLVFIDDTKGWLFTNESNVADLGEALFVTATGGTIATSGDYKVHTFTGDGCFVVSCGGTPSGNDKVDYLVIAGGGGGASTGAPIGGGGAGGYRESHSTPVSGSYTASNLATPTGLTVTTTTYPVTVGGGGAATPSPTGNNGSNSIFSTITSAGGGFGSAPGGNPGGSGGGGGAANPGGTGNTPPVSPSQGQPGGSGYGPGGSTSRGGGGGGANAAGSDGPAGPGSGGAGETTSINGTPTTRAGGGGGGSETSSAGTGGSGGGGNGGQWPSCSGASNGTG